MSLRLNRGKARRAVTSANIEMDCYHITSQLAFSGQAKILDPLLVKQYSIPLLLLKSLVLFMQLDVGGQLYRQHYERISLVPHTVRKSIANPLQPPHELKYIRTMSCAPSTILRSDYLRKEDRETSPEF